MKYQFHLFLLPALFAGPNLISASLATAQTFTFLHRFNESDGSARMPVCFYRETSCMGRQQMAAARALARCSPSTLMARVLQACIALVSTAAELFQMMVWFYQATTLCMGRRGITERSFMARCSVFRSGRNRPSLFREHPLFCRGRPMSPGSITPGLLCNPPRAWFHRRSGAPILPHQLSSTGRTP